MEGKEDVALCGVKTMQLNDQKAGMQGLNKEMINKIIFEASKGTPYFAFQEKRQKSIDTKVKELQCNIKKITEIQKKESLEKMTALGVVLENERNLNRSIVHIDMDAFYAAVEMQDDPDLAEKPMAVGSLSMLSTSNYHARKYGVRAAMPGFIAKKLCPELVIVPCNFAKYRKVSDKIRNIVKDYDPDYCAASLDEVYLDLTDYIKEKYKMKLHNESCLKNYHEDSASEGEFDTVIGIEENCKKCLRCCQNISVEDRDTMAYETVKEIRQKIYDSTQLTASAGIAPNTMLAKVCSDQNKPNGQYQIVSMVDAVKSFIATLPVKKISGIGPVQGQILNAIGIHTCSDMWEKRDLVNLLFSETSVDFYIRVALGIGSTVVKSDHVRKSIGNEHTFREIYHPADLHRKCQELCDELIEDLKSRNMLGKVVILKIKTTDFQTHTRNHSLSHYTSDVEIVYKAAKKLIDAEIAAIAPKPLKLRLMGVRMANLVYEDSVPQSEKQLVKLKDFIQSKSLNAVKKTSPVKGPLTNCTCPVPYTDCKTSDNVDVCKSTSSIPESIPREHWNNKSLNYYDNFVSENSLSAPSFISDVESFNSVISYSCPVCGLNQNFNNLIQLNAHIDNCLNKVAIKEILADDSLGSSKRKLPHDKQSLKKIKTERRIEDYFRRNIT